MRAWFTIDIDQLDPPAYARIAGFDGAFKHPAMSVLYVPFSALSGDSGVRLLIEAGAPPSAIHTTEKRK